MKRLWISAALILSLALLAGCHVLYLGRLTGELVDLLDQAQEQVLQDDWSQAEALTSQSLKLWQRHEFYLHSTMRHNDIDTVLVAFHEVLAFLEGQERQPAEYAAANRRLTTQLELLLESELPTLQNLL